MSEALTTLFGAEQMWLFFTTVVGGGVGLKVVEYMLNKNASNRGLRTDWLTEIAAQNSRIDALESEIETWRTKYYDQQVQIAVLKVQVVQLGGTVE